MGNERKNEFDTVAAACANYKELLEKDYDELFKLVMMQEEIDREIAILHKSFRLIKSLLNTMSDTIGDRDHKLESIILSTLYDEDLTKETLRSKLIESYGNDEI